MAEKIPGWIEISDRLRVVENTVYALETKSFSDRLAIVENKVRALETKN